MVIVEAKEKMILDEPIRKLRDYIEFNKIPLEQVAFSFSGGKDSTLLLWMVEQLGWKNKVKVVFFDTRMEYDATYRFVEQKRKEGWNIDTQYPRIPAPIIYTRYGIPIISKVGAEMLYRLQKWNFDFINDTLKEFEELIIKYPKCKSALQWLTGYGRGKIKCPVWIRNKLAKEGLNFKVANDCCKYLKKLPVYDYVKAHNIKISVTGERIAEGGARSFAYHSCLLPNKLYTKFMPLLYLSDEDVMTLIKENNIQLNECYTKYGLKRTGCVACPFSQNIEHELEILKQYEPNKHTAMIKLLGNAYPFKIREKKND